MATRARGDLRLDLYQDSKGGWRWRLWRGAYIVADGAEAYARKDSLWRAVQQLAAGLADLTGLQVRDLTKRGRDRSADGGRPRLSA